MWKSSCGETNLDGLAKEAALVELYRRGSITQHQLAESLDKTRFEIDELLKQHKRHRGSRDRRGGRRAGCDASSAAGIMTVVSDDSPLHYLVLIEAEAISLALEMRAKTLLIDERDGTRIARGLGVATAGTLGVLVLASAKNLLSLEQ